MAKEGSTIGGLMDSLGTATSVALQYGVPIESLVNKFTHQRFEPAGMTMNPEIPFAKSLVDYIFRWMGMQFVPGYREAVAPKRPSKDAAPAHDRLSDAPSALPRFRTDDNDDAPKSRPAAAPVAKKRPTHDDLKLDVASSASADVLSVAMRDMQGDAPACEVCGTITVRNGACYKCLNCGHSMGCS
jgi:ribonucleoside-diphosphate reductase alpha chain